MFELEEQVQISFSCRILYPFIDLLKTLVEAGANHSTKVDKLEFYRELDKYKQKFEVD